MINNNDFLRFLKKANFRRDKDSDIYYVDGSDLILEDLYLNGFDSFCFDYSVNASLLNSTLVNSYISGNLKGNCLFENVLFYRCNLSRLSFEGKIRNCKFVECDFFEAMLNGSEVSNAVFYKCDFSAIGFSYCIIGNTDFVRNTSFTEEAFIDNKEVNVNWIF